VLAAGLDMKDMVRLYGCSGAYRPRADATPLPLAVSESTTASLFLIRL